MKSGSRKLRETGRLLTGQKTILSELYLADFAKLLVTCADRDRHKTTRFDSSEQARQLDVCFPNLVLASEAVADATETLKG